MADDDDDEDRDMKILKRHVAQLGEHFDTVQIFATRSSADGGTIAANWGGGNWFARFGQVKAWTRGEENGFGGGDRPDDDDDDGDDF